MGAAVGTAVFSADGRYRYLLIRREAPGPLLTLILLNPSVADAARDDRTVTRCRRFAREHGFAGLRLVNLYAFRATRPADLWRVPDPVGPDNDAHLTAVAAEDGPVVAAWGAFARPSRVHAVLGLPNLSRLWALGLTRDGHPRHPLYLPAAARLQPWSPPT